MKFCNRFYDYLYIDNNEGGMCLCPWMEIDKAFIGRLMTDDVDVAFNSDHANHLRATMDDQTFRCCRFEACPRIANNELEEITPEEYERRKKERYYPTQINMAYDFVCNQSCETCRKSMFVPPQGYAEQMGAIQDKLGPYLNTAKLITASGHGDPFASPYMMKVLENLHPENPDLSILLETNGVFFDESHWERIKHLKDCRLEIVVTTNSFDEFTYRHVSRGGNYEKLMHNLPFISQLRKDGDITNLTHSLVIQDRNFREVPSFVTRSFSDYMFDYVVLKPVYQWGTMNEDIYWFKDVSNPCHPYHAEYLEILKAPALKDPRVYNFGGDTLHKARPYPGQDNSVKFPFSSISNSCGVVIFGAGQIGKEYIRQLEETRFCKVVLWVDKNGDGNRIMMPDAIKRLSPGGYDYIVLATKNPAFIAEMKAFLSDADVPGERIICGCC